MKQRNRKLACLCITTALLATANTTTAVAHESKVQVVEQEQYTLHTGAATVAIEAANQEALREEMEAGEAETEETDETDSLSEEQVPEVCIEQSPELAVAQVNSYINVRNQPGLEGEIIGKLYNHSVGEIIGEEGEWLKISSGSVEGYIKAEYALRGEEGAAKAEEVGERHAKVQAVTLRLREAATTESRTVELLPQEAVLPVQEETEGWVKVTVQETEGYVSTDHVEVYTVYQVAESKAEEEERLRREEEARRAEEAARAAEEAARTAARVQENSSSQAAKASTSAAKPKKDNGSQFSAGTNTPSTGSLGQNIVNYAMQFVGNPYVYGGTSLTNGADCSGFVMSVYKHFGINLPRTSGEQGKCGTNVGGIQNAQPGDLVSYAGHIGIYIGNGQIVHASSAKTGIKVSNATYRPILSVRRIV